MLNLLNPAGESKRVAPSFAPGGDFKKKLRWHIAQSEPHAVPMLISPADAEEMLKRNSDDDYRNRPLNENEVRRYAQAMSGGQWFLTGETIIFSHDGVLLNGQHRLTACIRSGVAFQTFVVFGIDRDGFKFMDRGMKRTAAHVFSIEGIPNAATMAAAIKWVHQIKNCNGWTGGQEDRLESEMLLALYYENECIQASAWVAHAIDKAGHRLIAPTLMVALHYLFAKKSKKDADEFMTKVVKGTGLEEKDPENLLRSWLLKDNVETGGRTHNTIRAAYVVLAWNARRDGRQIKLFRWQTKRSPKTPFPTIR